MRNLESQLQLIREGFISDEISLQLEADTIGIQNLLTESAAEIDLIEAEQGSFIDNIKERIRKIVEVISKMINSFIEKIKTAFKSVKEKILKKNVSQKKDEPVENKGADKASESKPTTQAKTTVESVKIPVNILKPRNGFNLKNFANVIYGMILIADVPSKSMLSNLNSPDDVYKVVINKVFHQNDISAMNSADDLMEFIYGKEDVVKVSSIDNAELIKEIDKFDDNIKSLQELERHISRSAAKSEDFYNTAESTNTKVQNAKYVYYLYLSINKLVQYILAIYSKRYSYLMKMLNAIQS